MSSVSIRWFVLPLLAASFWSASALAQSDASTIPAARNFTSPERFIIELRGGPYSADFGENPAYERFFGDDAGPFLGVQLSYIAYRVPDIAYATIGGGFGWTNFSASAIATDTGESVGEETTLTLLPLAAIASVRIDALARKLSIPFIFAGKLGFQWTHWDTATGTKDEASGWSLGLAYGAQVALDLDAFDSAAARSMDEEWGINHSFVLFEVFHHAPTGDSFPVGGTNWLLGLGFNF